MVKGSIRTFIAIDVPQDVKQNIRNCQLKLATAAGVRVAWTKAVGIHLTLKFIGDVERETIPQVIRSVELSAAKFDTIKLTTTIAGGFPNVRRPRVLWLGVEGNNILIQLQQDIDKSLGDLGFLRDSKKFHPHLTVGRVKSLDRDSDLPRMFEDVEFPEVSWEAEAVNVMSSVLKPSGAEYSVLASCPLGK